MALFSERNSIPTKHVHKIEEGKVGERIESKTEGRNSIIRELEIDGVMSIATARAIRDWLTKLIDAAERVADE